MIEYMFGCCKFLDFYEIWKYFLVIMDYMWSEFLWLINISVLLDSGEWLFKNLFDGLLVLIVNYFYGIGDGLVILLLVEQFGCLFKIMINNELLKFFEIRLFLLLVDFEEIKDVFKMNMVICKEVLKFLVEGMMIIVFFGGGVVIVYQLFGWVEELFWKIFIVKMICFFKVIVLLIYFEGQNFWLFYFVSWFLFMLCLLFYVCEF